MPEPPLARSYSAFISYRHADNRVEGRRWAEWLHQAIEAYEVPEDLIGTTNQRGHPVPASLFPVFRDEEELPADADLSQNIRRALENSGSLIVLCSPQACESRFVHDEICYFKELGHSSRILSVLLEGEPNASDDPGKLAAGFDAAQECLPLALRIGAPRPEGGVDWEARAEPIAADVRPQGLTQPGWTTAAAYRSALVQGGGHAAKEINDLTQAYTHRLELAVLKIVAGLLGVPLGLLTERDKARQLEKARRQAARLRLVVTIFVVLTALAVVMGAVAWVQKQRADTKAAEALRAQNVAEAETQEAEKRRLEAEEAQRKEQIASTNERTSNERRRLLLVEAARTDRLAGLEKLGTNRQNDAFAHFARALTYDPDSTLPAEAVFASLNHWSGILPKAMFAPGRNGPSDVQFTADGQRVFAFDTAPGLWDAGNGKGAVPLDDKMTEFSAHLSADGQVILTISAKFEQRAAQAGGPQESLVRLWDAKTGKLLATVGEPSKLLLDAMHPPGPPHTAQINKARLSPDHRRVITVIGNLTAHVWDVTSGNELAVVGGDSRGHLPFVMPGSPLNPAAPISPGNEVLNAEFSADNRRILTGTKGAKQTTVDPTTGGTVSFHAAARLWEATEGRPVTLLGTLNVPGEWQESNISEFENRRDAQFSPDGQRFLCVEGKLIYVADTAPLRLLATLKGHTEEVTSARFSPDGRQILTASADHTVRLWRTEDGLLLHTYDAHQDRVNGAEFSPDGKSFVTASDDQTARFFGTSEIALPGHENKVIGARFSPDGQSIVTACEDTRVRIWQFKDSKLEEIVPAPASTPRPLLMPNQRNPPGAGPAQTSPDGKWRAEITNQGVELTNVTKGKSVRINDSPRKDLGEASYGANYNGFSRVCFSRDSRMLFTARYRQSVRSAGGLVQAWDVSNHRLLFTLEGHGAAINSLTISADGKRLLTGSDDKTARVWDPDARKQVAVLSGHRDTVFDAQFNADGTRIVTASRDKTIRLWNAANGELIGVVSADGLNPTEVRGYSHPDGPQFGPGGGRIVETAENGTIYKYTVLPLPAATPPVWFPQFLLYMGQRQFNSAGELEDIRTEKWLEMREALRNEMTKSAGADTPYDQLLRRFVPAE